MADFQLTGRIEGVRFSDAAVFVMMSEYRMGYKKSDGTRVPETYNLWTVVYKDYFKKYIAEHFSKGMLVTVKGEVQPYRKVGDEFKDGYTVIGQTINLAAYHKDIRTERKMQKESQLHSTGTPDYASYRKEDF